MDDSKKDASNGILHGTVYRAGFQEAGRGRIKGRTWLAERDENLLFTVVFRRKKLQHELNHMPLIAGVSLVSAVTTLTGKSFNLKWPNDLLYKGKKCSGILCEADNQYFYCGIGINCNQSGFPDGLEKKSTSLKIITGQNISVESLLEKILNEFLYYLNNGEAWRDKLRESLYRLGEDLEVQSGHAEKPEVIRGMNLGIGRDGQLLIRENNGTVREIYAGEIEIS